MRTALWLLCGAALLGLAGCAMPGGVEIAGPASQVSPPPSPPTLPSGTPVSADAIAILRADPQINDQTKAALVPCAGGYYPIDQRYADLTHDGTAELMVTVRNCVSAQVAEKQAIDGLPPMGRYVVDAAHAIYVYDLKTDPPTRLLGIEDGEDSGIDMVPSRGLENSDLLVFRDKWLPGDDPCCPSATVDVLYRWDGTTFVEVAK